MKTIGFIGAGNMAGAIINSLGQKYPIAVFDIDCNKMEKYKAQGHKTASSEAELVKAADLIFLSVKPAHLCTVLDNIESTITGDKILISIVAGASTDFIKKRLGNKSISVVRVMPNTPALLGKGATAACFDNLISEDDKAIVKDIFNSVGIIRIINEDKMNEVISVNGSSPAYAFMFIKALIDGGVEQGLDKETSKDLAIATLAGSVAMVQTSQVEIETLIKQVCSPNGTTLKAVEVLEKENFEQIVKNAMMACTKRAEEIESELGK